MSELASFHRLAAELAVRGRVAVSEIPTTDLPVEGLFLREHAFDLELLYTERGGEEPVARGDAEEVAYHVFRAITSERASAFEVTHRRSREDSRRQLFAVHERLMANLRTDWGRRLRDEHRAILDAYPFEDR